MNSVNVIFGNLLFASQDLAVPGPLPLNLIRYYNSENNERDWIPGTGMSTNYPLWIQGVSVPREEDQKIESSKGARSCIQYSYDKYGNITEEKLQGNLTGTSRGLFSVSDDGKPKKSVESYSKYYSYTDDRFHLCEKQSEDHGPTIEYEYKKDTDLLLAKFIKDESRTRVREFYGYDTGRSD